MTDFSHHSSYSQVLPTSPTTDNNSLLGGGGEEEGISRVSHENYFEPVMYIGPDSLALFQSISHSKQAADQRPSPSRGLDVFCGCGIQGVTALKINLLDQVTFVEKNHRAIRFLRFNLLLNSIPLEERATRIIHDSVHNIHSHLSPPTPTPHNNSSSSSGSGNSSLPCPQFQLILANPPYIPTGLPKTGEGVGNGEERGLLGYGAGGGDGEEFIAFVYTDLLRYLALPTSPSEAAAQLSSGIYLVSNLVNVQQYPAKLSQWIEQSSGNAEFLEQLKQQKLRLSSFISHDKPWTPQEYAQLILNRENQVKGSSPSEGANTDPNVDQYSQDLIKIGIENVCNGLVFMKLHPAPSSASSASSSSDEDNTSTFPAPAVVLETRVEECPEQVWQLLNLPETFKERYLEIQQRLSDYLI
jgi:methylase of polypeptide subunit release factors